MTKSPVIEWRFGTHHTNRCVIALRKQERTYVFVLHGDQEATENYVRDLWNENPLQAFRYLREHAKRDPRREKELKKFDREGFFVRGGIIRVFDPFRFGVKYERSKTSRRRVKKGGGSLGATSRRKRIPDVGNARHVPAQDNAGIVAPIDS